MYTTALVLLFIIKIWKNSNNFFEYLRSCYGAEGVRVYRKLEDAERKSVKNDLDIAFFGEL